MRFAYAFLKFNTISNILALGQGFERAHKVSASRVPSELPIAHRVRVLAGKL